MILPHFFQEQFKIFALDVECILIIIYNKNGQVQFFISFNDFHVGVHLSLHSYYGNTSIKTKILEVCETIKLKAYAPEK